MPMIRQRSERRRNLPVRIRFFDVFASTVVQGDVDVPSAVRRRGGAVAVDVVRTRFVTSISGGVGVGRGFSLMGNPIRLCPQAAMLVIH